MDCHIVEFFTENWRCPSLRKPLRVKSIGNVQREQVEQTMELGDWDTIEHSDDD